MTHHFRVLRFKSLLPIESAQLENPFELEQHQYLPGVSPNGKMMVTGFERYAVPPMQWMKSLGSRYRETSSNSSITAPNICHHFESYFQYSKIRHSNRPHRDHVPAQFGGPSHNIMIPQFSFPSFSMPIALGYLVLVHL